MENNNPVGTDEHDITAQPDENNNPVDTDEPDTTEQPDENNSPVDTDEPDVTEQPKKNDLSGGKIALLSVLSVFGTLFVILRTILVFFTVVIVFLFMFFSLMHPAVSVDGRTNYEYYGTGRVKTESVYDNNGRLLKQTRYDDEGFFVSESKYRYGENGKLVTEEKIDDYKTEFIVREYDENNRVFRESIYRKDTLMDVILYEYDSSDRKIKESHYSSSDDLEYWLTYQYHEKTGWLTWIKYDASGKMLDSGGYSIPK